MDSSTQRLKDMIQRMTELDTPEQAKQQLDEMTNMNISMSGETADEVASLLKMLGNAGVTSPEVSSVDAMPVRQDMERLASIMGEPEMPAQPPEAMQVVGDMGPQVTGEETLTDAWSSENAKEMEMLHDLVRAASKNDRGAKRKFEEYVSKHFTGIDSARLLVKLTKFDDHKQVEELHNLVRDGQRQNTNAQASTYENLDEWSSDDAATLEMLHSKVQSATNGDARAGAQFEDYIDNNFPNVDSEELLAKLVQMDDNQQFETLHDLLTSEYQNDTDDDYTDQSMHKGELGLEGYDNAPEEDYQDAEYMTKDISGGLNREKKAYAKAQDGDNAMAVESIKDRLYARLSEKKDSGK